MKKEVTFFIAPILLQLSLSLDIMNLNAHIFYRKLKNFK